ncbi:MAG: type II toxin-antitoxin system VapC family toxin [Thermococcus sp.]|uniref:type II toxin-antitoxin system VapC family toxin n=1 Tax=Thermococcus sp. TaxID=35749 RepID=UPI00260B7EF8|nr:type II toxin-antitoxin system VapC family toxin [Thermococcus sp.]MCD6139641.1 type II toxin-antitoxin system VapC family toxin [Thermococcus sp.]
MRGRTVYLDSSAIIKRYIKEKNSEEIIKLYRKAYNGDVKLSFSLWNIGEVLGVLDKARRLERLDIESYELVRARFLSETLRMKQLGVLRLIPVHASILEKSWQMIEKYHIYQADAIQILSSKKVNADEFYTGDKRLNEVAISEGLNSVLV